MCHNTFSNNFKCRTSDKHNFTYLGLRGGRRGKEKKRDSTLFAYKTVLNNFFKTKHQMSRFPQMLQMNAVVTLPVWEDLLPKPEQQQQQQGLGPLQALFVCSG